MILLGRELGMNCWEELCNSFEKCQSIVVISKLRSQAPMVYYSFADLWTLPIEDTSNFEVVVKRIFQDLWTQNHSSARWLNVVR